MTGPTGTPLPLGKPQYSRELSRPGSVLGLVLGCIACRLRAILGNFVIFVDLLPSWYNPPTIKPTVSQPRGLK